MKCSKLFSRFNSLTTQIFSYFWIVFFLLLLIAFLIPQFDNRNYSELTKNEFLEYQKQIVTAFRENRLTQALMYKNRPFPFEITDTHPILLNTETQQLLGVPEEELESARQFTLLSTDISKPLVKTFYNIELAGPFSVHINSSTHEDEEEPYLLYFIKKVDPQRNFVTKIFDRPYLLFVLIMTLSTPLLLLLAWRISRPLQNLNHAARAVASGDFTVTPILETQGVTDFRRVGKSFNQMTESISHLLKTHHILLSSVSHELRTPLTRLHLATALLRRRVGENNEIARIETEISRLDSMINDLLEFSRNQVNIYSERKVFALSELWEEVVHDAEFEAEQRNIKFYFKQDIQKPEQYKLLGNQQSLASALENILRNALKYTKSKIAMRTQLQGHYVYIFIDDNGTGVKEEEFDKIFQLFYRVDEARTRTIGGTGLGLAIVENNITQHYGKVWAEKSTLGGLCVTIVLPLYTGGVTVINQPI